MVIPGVAEDTARFVVQGNQLIVTRRFDPRHQRDAEGELLRTVQGMIEQLGGDTFVLDLCRRPSMPSMLVGVIVESFRRVARAGGTMILRVREDHLQNLQWAGMARLFQETGRRVAADGVWVVDFTNRKA